MADSEDTRDHFSDKRALRNAAFSFLGRASSSLITLLFIPVFIRMLDAESWGIVAFSISLAAMAVVFDFGFGSTLTRELARRSSTPTDRHERADLLFSLEVPYLLLCCLVGGVIWSLAGFISRTWLDHHAISTAELRHCIQFAGFSVGTQLLASFYGGGLQGLQMHLALSVMRTAYSLLLYGGGCLLLYLMPGSSVVDFFAWQAFAVLCYVLPGRYLLYRSLDTGRSRGNFAFRHIRNTYHYSLGVAGTTALVVCLTQLDKLLLSKLLDLEAFGIYMIAVSATSVQIMIVQPVQAALFPQLSGLLRREDHGAAGEKFLLWSQRVALLIFPLGAVIVVYSEPLAFLWLHDTAVAARISVPMSILAAGSMLNAVVTLPYTLQLSAGWPGLGFFTNVVALAFMIPAVILLTREFGEPGAAAVWLLLNLGYVMVQTPLMFRRLLRQLRFRWYRDAFILPCASSLAIAFGVRELLLTSGPGIAETLLVTGTSLFGAMALIRQMQIFMDRRNGHGN